MGKQASVRCIFLIGLTLLSIPQGMAKEIGKERKMVATTFGELMFGGATSLIAAKGIVGAPLGALGAVAICAAISVYFGLLTYDRENGIVDRPEFWGVAQADLDRLQIAAQDAKDVVRSGGEPSELLVDLVTEVRGALPAGTTDAQIIEGFSLIEI